MNTTLSDPKTIKKLINVVNEMLPEDDKEPINKRDVEQCIKQARCMTIFKNITDEEAAEACKKIITMHSASATRGTAIVNRDHKKWFLQKKPSLDMEYWERFKQYLKSDKHFSNRIIANMDLDTDEIVDLLGNPDTKNAMQRRGLIIGDVQSGKTANYSGVICKAADAGYRVIILLAGTSNDLRRQTQSRLDEAFLGFDSSAATRQHQAKIVGVGKYNSGLRPIAVTNTDRDFSRKITQVSMGLPKNGDSAPMLFVCKKNVGVLESLYNWIDTNNRYGNNKIDNSLLMIDDEADYASINTKRDDDPTATNKWIRKILEDFRFASYVGFTATPYANIFIDPASNEAMENEDLFPADYIYALESSSNYIGARDIFGPEAKYESMLVEIRDGEDYYPLSHKKDSDFRLISPSLKEAINVFLVGNVIRDLRNDTDSYRSMMVNVSRYINTQNQLHGSIKTYITECQKAIRAYSKLPVNDALDNEYIRAIYEAFEGEFSNTDYSWDLVQKHLEDSLVKSPILVLCANQGNKDLDYSKYADKIRAIVVGGQALSRGLTLEGLMISYIYRHSLAYDTLMQMGRWFGYRDGYADCCRIYMDPESIAWYSTISNATDELRKEIKRMNLRGAIPLEFGLKVREDPEVPLIVTARNKMRSTFVRTYASSLSSTMVETQSLYSDDEHNQNNLKLIRNFIDKNNSKLKKDKKLFCLRNVDRSDIIDLLNNIAISELNTRFDPFAISDFIKKYAGRELEEWDVVFATGVGATYQIADGIEVKLNKRRASLVRDNKFLLLNHNRLGSADDMSFGLSAEQKVLAQVQTGDKKHPSANDFLSQEIGPRKPLLVIYFVEPTDKSGDKLLPNNQIPAIGFAIGIPYLADQETKYINYRVNRIHEAYGEILDDEDEEDDVEAKTDDNNENDRNNKNDQDNK